MARAAQPAEMQRLPRGPVHAGRAGGDDRPLAGRAAAAARRAYREIHDRTRVSVTTIGRVARTPRARRRRLRRRADRVPPASPRRVPPSRLKHCHAMSPHRGVARQRRATACASPSRNPAASAEPARALLASCGLSWRESRDRLFCYGESLPIDLLLVRDDDIPGLIADGVCDLGIVGRNVLLEQDGERARQRPRAGVPRMARRWASAAAGWRWRCPRPGTGDGPAQLAGKRIATSYPALLSRWLAEQGIDADVGAAVGFGRDRAAPGPGRRDLRPGVQRRHAGGQPAQAGGRRCWRAKRCWPARPRTFDDVRGELAELLLRRLDGVLRMRATASCCCSRRRATRCRHCCNCCPMRKRRR